MLVRMRFSLCLSLLVLVAGCATSVQVPGGEETLTQTAPANWSKRVASLAGFKNWKLEGKLSVTQPKRSDTAVINLWRQHGREFELHLSSTIMGLGSTQLSGDPGFVELTTGQGKDYVSAKPEQLLQRELGWSLPLDNLRYWIKGIPNPDHPAQLFFDADGRLKRLQQAGWKVHYRRPHQFIKGLPPLPKLITAENGPVRIRVAVLHWQRVADGNNP